MNGPNFDDERTKHDWAWDQVDEINALRAVCEELTIEMAKMDTSNVAYHFLYAIYTEIEARADALFERVLRYL